MHDNGYWYLTTPVVHAILFVAVALLLSSVHESPDDSLAADEPLTIDLSRPDEPDPQVTHFQVGDAPLDPSVLDPETLMAMDAPSQTAAHYDDSPEFQRTPVGAGPIGPGRYWAASAV